MTKDPSIIDLMAIRVDGEDRYVAERGAVLESMSKKAAIGAIKLTDEGPRHYTIKADGEVSAAPLKYSLFGSDYERYMDALRANTESREGLSSGDDLKRYMANEGLAESEARMDKVKRLYPGLKSFLSAVGEYGGSWIRLSA